VGDLSSAVLHVGSTVTRMQEAINTGTEPLKGELVLVPKRTGMGPCRKGAAACVRKQDREGMWARPFPMGSTGVGLASFSRLSLVVQLLGRGQWPHM
jgi:hypothetical protein